MSRLKQPLLLVVLALSLGAAFGPAHGAPSDRSSVVGTVGYRHRIALPADAVVTVSLQDTTLADAPALSYTIDEACLLAYPRRDLSVEEAESARHGRTLAPAGIADVYAAVAPDGQVIALLADDGPRTRSVVVVRPATL